VDAGAAPRAVSVAVAERCGGSDRLVTGDCLDVAGALAVEGLAGSVDLVYVDPPYMSQADYTSEARLDGPADGRVTRTLAYEDSWGEAGIGDYLDMLAPRLEALAALLSPAGSLWVHLDWRASYLVRVLLDEIFGREGFKNEIVWRRAPNLGRQAASGQFGRTIDTIVVYGGPGAKIVPPTRLEPIEKTAIRWDDAGRPFTTAPRGDYTDKSIERLEAEGRVHRTASGRVYVKYFLVKNEADEWCRERRVDALWTDVPPLRHAAQHERTGFPTQKPRALLERIIRAATPEGGLVVDAFAGSGTTGDAAHVLGRRFVLGDASPVAIATARARLLRTGARFTLERCGEGPRAASFPPEVRVSQAAAGGARVELASPEEPLAWAVDTAYDEARAFSCVWHSERTPGARPVPAAKEAIVARTAAGKVAVRVYADDGSVGTVVHPS
jgi:DNA modification methylase